MMAFVTLSSVFVGSMVLVITYMVSGEMALALLPIATVVVTGGGITRMMVAKERPYRED